MRFKPLHNWDLGPQSAIALQTELSALLANDAPLKLDRIQRVAGVDVSVKSGQSRAAVVVMTFPDMSTTLETVRAQRATDYPYIPGLLAFREGPVVLEALSNLRHEPDAIIFDGMGQIHPRRMGIAAHLGLWLGRPTVGCGKTHYIGEYQEPPLEKGSRCPLFYRGQQLGVVLRTRRGVKPVYVSCGHLADLDSAVELVLSCTTRFRLPDPIRAAHKAASLA